jgi:hypothetical protein
MRPLRPELIICFGEDEFIDSPSVVTARSSHATTSTGAIVGAVEVTSYSDLDQSRLRHSARSSARDHLHLVGGPAGGRDEHLVSGVGVALLKGRRRAVERHALDFAAGR